MDSGIAHRLSAIGYRLSAMRAFSSKAFAEMIFQNSVRVLPPNPAALISLIFNQRLIGACFTSIFQPQNLKLMYLQLILSLKDGIAIANIP